MVRDHTRTEREMRMSCWSGFPCSVYIDSNRRDSQIWVPLVCGSHHVVSHEPNFINVIIVILL
jgi:hypothetical protein